MSFDHTRRLLRDPTVKERLLHKQRLYLLSLGTPRYDEWLFADTVRGAQASASFYSLIETAKANGLEPYAYLRLVFTELPSAATLEHIEALLPWNVDRGKLQAASALQVTGTT